MFRRFIAACAVVALSGAAVLVSVAPAGAAGPRLKVTPSKGLTNNESVTITGTNLGKTTNGTLGYWFVTECNLRALRVRNLDPDYSPHCAPQIVQPLRVSPRGTFSEKFRVATGKVADGSCGVPGHMTCIIAVGTSTGRHVTARIRFKNYVLPSTPGTTTTKP
jgi:hypothetical protein